jgi:hypothetical protein
MGWNSEELVLGLIDRNMGSRVLYSMQLRVPDIFDNFDK